MGSNEKRGITSGPFNKRSMSLSKKKKERKRKKKEKFFMTLALKPEHSLRGIWQKSLKPSALNQLVVSHRLCCSLHGWIGGV